MVQKYVLKTHPSILLLWHVHRELQSVQILENIPANL